MGELSYKTRIYYDDTDAGGVVYFSNYLKLCERAKQEFFLSKGCDLFKLHYDGVLFVVKEIRANYISSLKLGDEVSVYVSVIKIGRASAQLHFDLKVQNRLVAEVEMLSVALDNRGNIVKLPECVDNLT